MYPPARPVMRICIKAGQGDSWGVGVLATRVEIAAFIFNALASALGLSTGYLITGY